MSLIQVTCVAVSANTNNFGLHRLLFLTAAGAGYEAYSNEINRPEAGARMRFSDWTNFAIARGWEMPGMLRAAPPAQARRILNEVAARRRRSSTAVVS
jgi:hypothetical protein